MRKVLLGIILCSLLLPLVGNAQNSKSIFQNLTWEQAATLAEKEGKIVLVDAMMPARNSQDRKKQDADLKKVFSSPAVAKFCKEHVIAIRMDMTTEAGRAFAPKMSMYMYPAYAFFMPNGDILGVASPFKVGENPEEMVKVGEKAWQAATVKRQNSRSIQFEELSLQEALTKAKKENKLVFIDAYTAWCQPCLLMVKNVFSLDRVADFYNEHFINLKMDFGKEKELAEKYAVSGYPAFLFLNGDGKPVHMAGGYTEGDAFVDYAREALKKAEGISFHKGTWQQALEQAKRENKLIFMDCYTSWCAPCKMMAKTAFTDPEVAEMFNAAFVNVKMDMEKGEGLQLKEKYEVTAFPTLHFINGDGEVVHTIVGGLDAKALMEQAEVVREGRGLAALETAYKNGQRDAAFISEYLTALGMANQGKKAEQVCLDYFATMDNGKLKEKDAWDLFVKYVNDVDSDVFAYVYEHRKELGELFGGKVVKAKIQRVWTVGANSFVEGRGEQAVFDAKGFKKYCKRLLKADVNGNADIVDNAKMNNAEKLGDWKTYIAIGAEQLKKGGVSDLVLYNWGLRISRQCEDTALRAEAARWFDEATAAAAKKEEAGVSAMMSYRGHFERLAQELKQPKKAN